MKYIFLFFTSFILSNTLLFSQELKGDRTLAWQVDLTESGDYDLAFDYAKDACLESVHIAITWSGLEPESGTFNPEVTAGILDVINIYYPIRDAQLELQIAVTNTTAKEVPSDLIDTPFDDPELINRFKIAVDTILTHLPDVDIAAINIGNESDILFGTDEGQYNAFKTFLDSVAPYTKTRYTELYGTTINVGTTLTFDGLTGEEKSDFCQNLNENLDIVSVTYYPLNSDFTMEDPEIVEEDFDALVEIYDNEEQPIYFVECGYSSSETCNSSEVQQAEFYSEVFAAWDKHYDNVKYLTIFKSSDWSHEAVETFGEYYGIDDPIFLEYLRTLGVRTWNGDGENKLAYEFILCELAAREWCAVDCALTSVLENSDKNELKIYPNPSSEFIKIENAPINSTHIVYSLSGNVVITEFNENIINLSTLEPGIYILETNVNHLVVSHKKFIKR